jgi:hypothetical protein
MMDIDDACQRCQHHLKSEHIINDHKGGKMREIKLMPQKRQADIARQTKPK